MMKIYSYKKREKASFLSDKLIVKFNLSMEQIKQIYQQQKMKKNQAKRSENFCSFFDTCEKDTKWIKRKKVILVEQKKESKAFNNFNSFWPGKNL